MTLNLKYCLAVVLLGMGLIGHGVAAAEVKQSKDDQGTVHITTPGKAEPGKPGTEPQPGKPPAGKTPEPPPESAPPPQVETPRPEPITVPPQMEEPRPEPFFAPFQEEWPPSEQAAAPPAEEAEPWQPVIILPEGVTVESEDSQEGGGPAVEEQAPPKGGRSPGRSGGGGGTGRGRGRR